MKVSKRFMWLLMSAAFAVIAAGGCGGGGGSSHDEPENPPLTAEIPMDFTGSNAPSASLDDSGVPILFAYQGGDIDIRTITASEKEKAGLHNFGGISVPAQISSVLLASGIDGPRDTDRFDAELEAGVRYSVEVSRSLADPLGDFIPDIIIAEAVNEPEHDDADDPSDMPGEQNEEAAEKPVEQPVEEPSDPDAKRGLDIVTAAEPHEDPSVVVLTFTPEKSGRYMIRISNSGSGSALNINYLLRVYRENGMGGEGGHPTQLMFEDKPLSLRDVTMLRRMTAGINLNAGEQEVENEVTALPQPPKRSGSGFPMLTANDEFSANLTSELAGKFDSIRALRDVDAAARSRIDPVINDIHWSAQMTNGAGFFAPSGVQAQKVAIEPFTLSKEIEEPESEYRSHFISTKEEHEEEMGIKTSGTFGLGAYSVGLSSEYSHGIKYSLTSTTLVIHYHKRGNTYSMTPGEKYTLSREASDYLDAHGYDEFRKVYGDYFLSGRRMGAQIDAYIAISTNSTEEVTSVKNKMSGKSPSISGSVEFTNALRDAITNTNVTVVIKQRGERGSNANGSDDEEPESVFYMGADGSFMPMPAADSENGLSFEPPAFLAGSNDAQSIMDRVEQFIKDSRASDFKNVTLDVRMDSYARAENAGSRIPQDIPVDPNCFVKTRAFVREMTGMSSYYNVLASLPDDNVKGGMKNGWKKKYDDMINSISSQLDSICASVPSLIDWTARVEKLSEEFRILSERWCFYRAMMTAQSRQRGDGFFEIGYTSFPISAVVNRDFYSGMWIDESMKEDWEWFQYWTWTVWTNNNLGSPWIWSYINIQSWSTGDKSKEQNTHPLIGKNRPMKWYFEGGTMRSVNWRLRMSTVRMRDADYPFVGL